MRKLCDKCNNHDCSYFKADISHNCIEYDLYEDGYYDATDDALAAYCQVECQRKNDMPCAHLADGGCTNYRKFIKAMKGE